MAIETFEVILTGLKFPDFQDDDSKKNFRILVTFFCRDKDGKSGNIVATLPSLDRNNWQWRKSDKPNFVPNDGHGTIHVDKMLETDRIIMSEKTDIRRVRIEILDVEDKNFLDRVLPVLKELEKIALAAGEASMGGIILNMFKPASAQVQKEVNALLDQLANEGSKALYRTEILSGGGTLKPDTYTREGKGTFKKTGDNLGDYSISVKVAVD